ncbi:MAG: SMP-30/gluconolactonase/LRE family protein [Desulfatitalea sp.]|nr:SMP-30/gluconolactonase/LRE family protein [Desulfatitalea sp.]
MNTRKFTIVALLVLALFWAAVPEGAASFNVIDKQYKAERIVADTPFPGVNGAAIGADGNLYVSHTGNGTITRIDLKTLKPSVFVPSHHAMFILDDITADPQGNLYATGTTPLVGEVYRIDANGVKTVIADGMAAPNGIEFNPRNGRLFVTECFQGNRVYEVDPMGQKPARLLIDADIIPVPEGFDFDPDTQDLIIPDLGTGRILRVHPDTGAIQTVAEGFTTPIALAIGPDKMVYVPELATGAVYKTPLDGSRREKIAQLIPGLDNLAITPQGRLFVTSYWDATIFEVATDGSGTFKQLFPTGPNQPLGIVVKENAILVADAIMIRTVEDGKYHHTKLNAWAVHGMPLTLSLADGPGDRIFWTDNIHGAVAIGDPHTGEFQPVAGGLNLPMSVLMAPDGARIFVAEYGAGQITAVGLADGAKTVLAGGLEGPLALALLDGTLYVAEAKAGRISAVDAVSGRKRVFLSAMVGKPLALANDRMGGLLVLDGAGRRLLRVNPQTMAVSVVAEDLPVQYATVGSYPPVVFPHPLYVTGNGDIYWTTQDRGLWRLTKKE